MTKTNTKAANIPANTTATGVAIEAALPQHIGFALDDAGILTRADRQHAVELIVMTAFDVLGDRATAPQIRDMFGGQIVPFTDNGRIHCATRRALLRLAERGVLTLDRDAPGRTFQFVMTDRTKF